LATAQAAWRRAGEARRDDRRNSQTNPKNIPKIQIPMTIKSNADTLITVFGGSGFLGRHVVRALAHRHYRIRVAVRRPDLAGHLQPLGRVGQIHAVQANLRHRQSVLAAVAGSDIVINLVGILFESGRQRFDSVQSLGAEGVALAAAAHNARMIHVSAIGAAENSRAAYGRAKWRGERLVLAAAPGATIFRPSILFGPNDDFFNRFAAMAQMSPVLPLIGGGRTRFQPVFAGDVAEAIAGAADGETVPGATYELGGPEVFTFKELMNYILATIGRRRLLLPLPFPLAKLQALGFELLSKVPLPLLARPLLTRDQVNMLRHDNVVSDSARADGRTLEGLGITPHPVGEIVPTYLWRFRRAGQFHDRVA
jgi:NADH dehydrogenase